jgi:hypothetical protein
VRLTISLRRGTVAAHLRAVGGHAGLAIVATALLAGPASAAPLPSAGPAFVGVDLPHYGGSNTTYYKCVAPCPFTATAPRINLLGAPYSSNGTGRWELHVSLSGGKDTNPETLPGSQSLSHVATELGYSVIHFNDEANKVLSGSSAFLVVSKADAPAPLDYLSSKSVRPGSVIRIKSPKEKFAVTFKAGGADSKKVPQVKCKKPVKDVHCFRLKRVKSPPKKARIDVSAWNETVIANLYGFKTVADRKVVRVKLR